MRPLSFLYESTGEETWFTNGLDPEPRARRAFAIHRPETLREWLEAELARRENRVGAPAAATLQGRMRAAKPLDTRGMWPAEIRAVQNLEASIREGRPRALERIDAILLDLRAPPLHLRSRRQPMRPRSDAERHPPNQGAIGQ